MHRAGFIIGLFLVLASAGKAQDSIPPDIHIEEKGDSMHLSARLRPLRQLAGAPSAYYSYFWELGDGHFSFEKDPSYVYRDSGTYQVRLYATNNYDDGKAPPTRPRPVRIKKASKNARAWASHFFHGDGDLEMKINRNPKPGENFVTVIGYRNMSGGDVGGSIVLFYNERQFGREGMALTDERFYNQEQTTDMDALLAALQSAPQTARDEGLAFDAPQHGRFHVFGGEDARDAPSPEGTFSYVDQTRSLLHTLQGEFAKHTVLHFPSIGHGEERFVFLEMNTLPEMIRDTNATVSFIAMLVPDKMVAVPQVFQLDMQVVASHDPNRLQLLHRRINYRFMTNRKELDYRVNFQNTGKGPTRRIAIAIAIPPELNSQSIRVKGFNPICRWCDSAYAGASCLDSSHRGDSVFFTFNNIYLPGLQQGLVTDPDSTAGYLEFTIRFKRRPKKIPFSTRAAITFDGNEATTTNKATARFIKGISPGIMAGYNYLPANGSYSATGPLQIGYVLAPYKPYRPYFQAEVSVVLLEQEKLTGPLVKVNLDTTILGQLYLLTGRQTITVTKRNSIDLTPLHFRYNLNDWVGVGAGATAQIILSEQTSSSSTVYFNTGLPFATIMTAATTQTSATRWIGSWKAEPFIDVQVGRVRTGPTLGLRYLRPLQGNLPDRFFLYAAFKL
jgi:hypothetical protein